MSNSREVSQDGEHKSGGIYVTHLERHAHHDFESHFESIGGMLITPSLGFSPTIAGTRARKNDGDDNFVARVVQVW